MFGHVKAIFEKELISGLRDRRSLMIVLFLAVYFPAVLFISLGVGASIASSGKEDPLYVVGGGDAPAATAYLRDKGVLVENVGTIEEALEKGDVVLVFEKGFENAVDDGAVGRATFVFDDADQSTLGVMSRIDDFLDDYADEVAVERLAARGLAADFIEPIVVERDNRSAQKNPILGLIAPTLGFMLFAAPFAAGSAFAVDVIAGERERKSLEPFVTRPISPLSIILGKWSFLALVGVCVSIIELVTLFLCVMVVGDMISEELPLTALKIQDLAIAFVCMIPLAMIGPALLLLFTMASKTLKEAQTASGFGMFIPLGLAGIGFVVDASETMPFAPFLSDPSRIGDAVTGSAFDAASFAGSFGLQMALLVVVLGACAWLLPKAARR